MKEFRPPEIYPQIPVEMVEIGERVRVDYGDLDALAQSIREVGLLQPIGVTKEKQLVFGERRLRACRDILGWTHIPARVIDIDSIAFGEQAENEIRKDFTPSERVAIAEKVKTALGERRGRPSEEKRDNWPTFTGERTSDIAADRAGFDSRKSYERARRVTESGAPELIEAMDLGQASVSAAALVAELSPDEQREIVARGEAEILRAAKEIRQRKAEENARSNAEKKAQILELPRDKYRCIVIDPPWEMTKIERDERPNQIGFDYPTMSEADLMAFPLPDFAADDCHLYLWTTHKNLPLAFRLAEHWGFRYQCLMTWVKNVGMTPFSWMYSTEHVLFCRRGSLNLERLGLRLDFAGKVREHSRKPDEFYDLVRQASPGPRIDIFSREKRAEFESWGNEADKFAEVLNG